MQKTYNIWLGEEGDELWTKQDPEIWPHYQTVWTHNFFRDFEIQPKYLIPARLPVPVIYPPPTPICCMLHFSVPVDNRLKIKGNEKKKKNRQVLKPCERTKNAMKPKGDIEQPWPENTVNTYARHTETLDSCFDLIEKYNSPT